MKIVNKPARNFKFQKSCFSLYENLLIWPPIFNSITNNELFASELWEGTWSRWPSFKKFGADLGGGTPLQNFLWLQMGSTYKWVNEWETVQKIYFWKFWYQNDQPPTYLRDVQMVHF